MVMDNSTNQQTRGLEKLEFLTDKAKRLTFELEADEKTISELKNDILQVMRKRKELTEVNRDLKTKLTSLQHDREKIDERISGLLGAIGELTID